MRSKYAIIGLPVEHSLSPTMHEAGFRSVGLNAEYHRIPISPSDLQQGIEFLKLNDYLGWNVTYPLKEKIIPFLDTVSPSALETGAVNTVKVVEGSLEGYNTDGEGFVQSLLVRDYDFSGKSVVLLGAGGASGAISVALAKRGVDLLILNRTEDKAEKLAKLVTNLGGKASWGVLDEGKWLKDVDLLIQTTSVGMKGEDYLFSLNGINSSSWVIDLIYKPEVSSFLRDAVRHGCKAINGLDMLLYQGALAWKIWFGLEAPVSVMREALRSGEKLT